MRPLPRSTIEPVAAGRWQWRIGLNGELKAKLDRLRGYLGHRIPDGDLDRVFEQMLDDSLEKHGKRLGFVEPERPRKPTPPKAPTPGKRAPVPRAVRREVLKRDGYRCTWVASSGERCPCTTMLEMDHLEPAAETGSSTAADLTTRCRGHNQYRAILRYGAEHVRRRTEENRRARDHVPPRDAASPLRDGSVSSLREGSVHPRLVIAALVGAALAVPGAALGAPQQLVVLRFTGDGFSRSAGDSATTAVETAALRVSGGRFQIVTRDMLATIVGEEKLIKCEAAARCELDLGVGLGTASYMLAGSARKVGSRVELVLKLYDLRKLFLVAQEKETGRSEDELLDKVEPMVERVMRTGLALGASAGNQPAAGGSFQEEAPALAAGGVSEVTVAFESAPEGAVVRVDGELLCAAAPCRKRVAAGAHKVVFEKERYAPATQNFTAVKGAVVKGTLAPRFGWLSVETAPPGLGISVDGADAGKSPVALREVDQGTVEVAISDPCWLRGGERVTVKAGERRLVKLVARPRLAGLKVNAEDEKGNAVEADVAVDGKPAGAAGEVLKVSLCARKVTVPLGKQTFEGELKLEEGKVAMVNAKPGAGAAAGGMVRLPGGTFRMGGMNGTSKTVQPFLLDVTAVTLAAYEACVEAGKCSEANSGGECNWGKADRASHPVNCVNWNQATAYCRWAKKRLPTEEEREWAARGAKRGTRFPWGNREAKDQLCWDGEGSDLGEANRKSTCVVGSFPGGDSPQGLKDLSGNVSEWTSSAYGPTYRVVRGGSWHDGGAGAFAAEHRFWHDPSHRDDVLGFRCARTP